MQSRQPPAYYGMIGLALAFSALAILTLWPHAAASKPNTLGYRSLCSFAPAATALCGLLAGVTCTIRNRVVSGEAASNRYQPLFVPIGVGLLLIAIALGSGIRYGVVESRFGAVIEKTSVRETSLAGLADGTRAAQASEGDISASVEITVSSGAIAELKLVGARNVPESVAGTIFEAVKEKQSTQVDAVSGATASSQVLLRAIEEAASAARR